MSSIVKVDTIQENTSANGITVDGLNIKDSKLVTANSVVTANITDANVTLAKLAGDSVNATKIADNAISEEHLDVTSITGHTAETSIADGDLILIHDASASALRKMTKANFVSGVGGANTPNFDIDQSGGQTVSNNTLTKMTFETEIFDADNVYNTTTHKLTLPTGKYLINFFCTHYGSSYSRGGNIYIYKNGSQERMPFSDVHRNSELANSHHSSLWGSAIVQSDGDDYFEFYFWGLTDTGTHLVTYKKIQGFKIIE